jgi:hypothetical protein
LFVILWVRVYFLKFLSGGIHRSFLRGEVIIGLVGVSMV